MRTMTRDDLAAAAIKADRESDEVELAAIDLPMLCWGGGGHMIWEGTRVVLVGGRWAGHATCQDERHAAGAVASALRDAAKLDDLHGRGA